MDEPTFRAGYTTWHITLGHVRDAAAFRAGPTVSVDQNRVGDPFVTLDWPRYERIVERLTYPPVLLTDEQRRFIESMVPAICRRGGWKLRVCAAKADHVHVLLDIVPAVHGEKVRRLLKRWVTEAMNEVWPPGSGRPGSLPATEARWWAEQGSNRAIRELAYLNNATDYVFKQRITLP